ncbi:MAG: T9SS type A sorting domain-containing protein [Brumimicrobium sp.]
MKHLILILISGLITTFTYGQKWVDYMNDPNRNFYEIQSAFYEEWEDKEYEKGSGWKQFKRWEWYMEPRVFPSGDRIPTQSAYTERKEFERNHGDYTTKNGSWSPVGFDEWESISYNPGIGRVNVIAEDPTDDQIIFAGTPSGGLWKTVDGGTNWDPLTDDFPTLGVSGLAINYNDPDIIYISTGDKDGFDTYSMGVVKSTDGGLTWNVTGLAHNLSQFVVCRKLVMHQTNPDELLVATSEGIYKSTDGGANWSQSASGDFRDIEYNPTNPSIVYASGKQFYKSTDGGDNFSVVTNGLPVSSVVNRMELAVSEDESDWVYAVCGNESDASFQGLYLSTDNGTTFQTQSTSPNIFGYDETGNDNSGQSWYDLAIDADPANANTIFVGGVNVWKSTNAGQNWQISSHWIYPSTYGYTHADIHELHFFGSNLYCGSDGGIFKTDDSGGNWEDLTEGMQISQFYRIGGSPQNANTIIGGTQDNGSILYKNNVWTHVMGADGMEAAINPADPSVMFCTYQFGGMLRSEDGGDNWNQIFAGDGEQGAWVTPYESLASDDVIAGYENVWLGEDNGDFFYPISFFGSGETIRDLDVAPSDEDVIYICFPDEVHKTEDHGNTWQNVTSNLPNLSVSDIHIHPTNPQIVWVTTSGYSNGNKVFVTIDGGTTWENISQNLPNIPANTIIYQNGTDGGLYVGMDVGVYYTDSTLSNWQTFDDDLPNVIVNELEIHYGSDLLRAATYGRGVWESDLFTPSNLPPEADFSTSSTEVCDQDSILFTDASTNAFPSWTWYFPGGSPSTSTLANPKVLYATNGSYDVSLVVENNNGTDSISKNINVSIDNGGALNLLIQTDQYPSETTWEIIGETGTILYSGGSYNSSETTYEEDFCLAEGCYDFVIYDEFGDGICCDYGTGLYELSDLDGLIVNGGQFGSSETTNFCIGEVDDASIVENDVNSFKLFPNPSADQIFISPFNDEVYAIKIIDAFGRTVLKEKDLTGLQEFNIADLSSGVYQVWIEKEHWKSSRKFVKE